jgi:hypothetical protein
MVSTTPTVLQDVENALQSAQTVLPALLNIVGLFYAPAGALSKFLPLIETAITAVEQVANATGTDLSAAQTAVVNHLTPGQPNAPALNG